MNSQRDDILFDRALIADLVLDSRRIQLSQSSQLFAETARLYKRILYEPSGASAFQIALNSIEGLAGKLVSISYDVKLDKNEIRLIQKTMEIAPQRIPIIQAIQIYERASQGPSRPFEEIFGYIVHLLLLARHYQADIAPWPARASLFLALFQEAGIKGSFTEIAPQVKLFKTESCLFPYLQQHESTESANHFGIIVMESAFSSELVTQKVTSILFLAADPSDAPRLRLGEEFRVIDEQLTLAKLRDHFNLALPQLSLRPQDISRVLLNVQPQIVHFSGHGSPEGALFFENEIGQRILVDPDALSSLFEQFENQVKCVLLNACYAEAQAKAISKYIHYVIGMNDEIGDDATIAFSLGFYQALGAGKNIEEAYKLGCVQIRLQGIPEYLTPVLIKKGQP